MGVLDKSEYHVALEGWGWVGGNLGKSQNRKEGQPNSKWQEK